MDIYEYLKLDHEKVAQLFKQFAESKLTERKKQIANVIAQELIVHAQSEQKTFYEALKQFDLTRDMATHGQKEHQEIEEHIGLVRDSREFGAPWIKKVNQLKELVDHHVQEEEDDIFKQAKTVLSEEEACRIKEQMHYLKHHLLLSYSSERGNFKETRAIRNPGNITLVTKATK